MGIVLHRLRDVGHSREGVGLGTGVDGEIAAGGDAAVAVEDEQGDGVVAVDDFEHEVEVGGFVGRHQRAHRLGPDLHFSHFFGFEVVDETMRDEQRSGSNDHRCPNKGKLDAPDAIGPNHG